MLSFQAAQLAAASEDNVEALSTLGNHYATATGTKEDRKKAQQYWELAVKRATEQKIPPPLDACFNLGLCHMTNNNAQQAIHWFLQSESLGDIQSQVELGNCYYHLLGQQEKGEEWWKKASKSGNCDAKMNLARHYLEIGNNTIAILFLKEAMDLGDPEAKSCLQDLYRQVVESQNQKMT